MAERMLAKLRLVSRVSYYSRVGLTVALFGCSSILGNKDPHDPGAGIGVYALSATADTTSSCAEVIASAPKPWTFSVTMRRDKTTGYWMSGADPLVGTIDDLGNITFSNSTPTLVHDVEKAKGVGACTIVRTDDFAGKFAGAPDSVTGKQTFTGTLTYSYSVQAGSDCRDVVGQANADNPTPIFAVMPCQARFAVTATRTGDAAK